MAVKADSIDNLSALAAKVKESGLQDILIAVNTNNKPSQTLGELDPDSSSGLKKNNRNLGYPVITVIEKLDSYQELIKAGDYIAKYAGIILLNTFEEWVVLSLLTLRQNIYTDPRSLYRLSPSFIRSETPLKTLRFWLPLIFLLATTRY